MTIIEIGRGAEELTQRQRWSHYFVFIYALLSYMSSHLTGATLRFRIDKS